VLDVKAKHILPAYEDAWYYMWRERQLPANVDPFESRLEDKEERARLARVFNQGLKKIVGYVLPLRRGWNRGSYWTSGPWFLRTEHLFLIPGDSPVGLRLPLDSVPWLARVDYPSVHPRDPMEQVPPLPAPDELRGLLRGGEKPVQPFLRGTTANPGRGPVWEQRLDDPGEIDESDRRPAAFQSADWVVRTALCVEPRNGRLHIFMPPVRTAEDYLDLIAAVEETATELKLPVVIEGSAPPHDPRLNHIKVTPDPGVIEVNLHPAHDWDELVKNTTALYEEARLSRLGTEKFMIDGRHVGTGGGNHVVVGGPTPADSPILRRPDLLRSLLGYWQNHPSLSFLFSGLFIGPTSQHPRVDEARNDSLYELEIAFKELDRQLDQGGTGHRPVPPGDPPGGMAFKPHGKTYSSPLGESPSAAGGSPAPPFVPPWLVDRIFRNLLIDVTGNTHRAEFCIDKLYAPESSSGRLGLLELRAFEMPPHARMSLTQQLLLRSLIARFWKNPYERPLVRWGPELHDRFMLPHFIEEDFRDVISDLQDNGYQLQPDWFAPHFEFRFPLYGSVTQRGVHLEIRQALEPWHVLGEQTTAGATSRYVDSSLERLQVKVRGMTDPRHLIACNGRAMPLRPTGTEGEYVGGVRFRGWQPPECLQPTIGVHAPLVFDIVDGWNKRSLGGCTYHVAHPGGRHYATLPVNSYEAESRRLARFSSLAHTPGPMNVPPPKADREFPCTLDLRKV
jgi:uncharacterized protein (DUF2126 family)